MPTPGKAMEGLCHKPTMRCWLPPPAHAVRAAATRAAAAEFALLGSTLGHGARAVYGTHPPGAGGTVASPFSANGPPMEADMYSAIAQLKLLRSLQLTTFIDIRRCTAENVLPHATSIACLGALTALTSLKLSLSRWYARGADRCWSQQQEERASQGTAWVEVQEAHRTSLLGALRCMLQLYCPTLWLRPSELPACLTALTSLTPGGLRPPTVSANAGSNGPADDGALPPQLQELVLKDEGSPRALADLRPQPSFTRLGVTTLRFGASDVTPDGRLRPEAVAAVGPAVRLLVGFRGRPDDRRDECMWIKGGGSGISWLLRCEDFSSGHMEWIRQLQGLDARWSNMVLYNVALSTGDLCCLGQTLPNLTGLELSRCYLPLAALPVMRYPMMRLARLKVNLGFHQDLDESVLESVLLLLCRPHPGAVPLEHLECACPASVDIGEVKQSVLGQLQGCYGVRDVDLVLWHSDGWM